MTDTMIPRRDLVPALELCTFRVDDLLLGIDVLQIQEVINHVDITNVPHSEGSILGLINLRGRIATAIDLGRRFGTAHDPDARPPSVHVVVRVDGDVVSLVVDSIDDVIEVDPAEYEVPPETMDERARELILGAYKLEQQLLLLPDVRRIAELASTDGESS